MNRISGIIYPIGGSSAPNRGKVYPTGGRPFAPFDKLRDRAEPTVGEPVEPQGPYFYFVDSGQYRTVKSKNSTRTV